MLTGEPSTQTPPRTPGSDVEADPFEDGTNGEKPRAGLDRSRSVFRGPATLAQHDVKGWVHPVRNVRPVSEPTAEW